MSESSRGEQRVDLRGKAVIITGGTTGIGRATAVLLAVNGANVFIFGRDEKELNDALNDIKSAGATAHGITADQASHEDMQRVFREADDAIGPCDILICNAGLAAKSLLEEPHEVWRYEVNTNLLGYMDCCQDLGIRRMRERGEGHIILIGSLSAESRKGGSEIYVATKYALQGFAESLRKSVQDFDIKVTLIEPGSTKADLSPTATDEEQEQKVLKQEMMRAEDIAECIEFCLTQPRRADIISLQIRPRKQSL